ncbi:hypothetical protein EH31_02320 [Erythrobacter longus]|uniref:Uncharacterized protein n=2 Tax=Erythrobacter longus TaxID=1044 RepID=A0A074MFF2_ERYLO|nr:hypothetical protein EH31_02320 [Erythrobacter longus]
MALGLALILGQQPLHAEEPVKPSFPLMQVDCETVAAAAGSPFDFPTARIMIPTPFHLVSSEKRLKLYKSLLVFEGGDEGYLISQPKITQADMKNSSGRFGDLQERQSDDDIPTGFTIADTVYEIQSVTSFPVTERIGETSFKIDQTITFRLKIEEVTTSTDRNPPVWQGDCVMTNVKAD